MGGCLLATAIHIAATQELPEFSEARVGEFGGFEDEEGAAAEAREMHPPAILGGRAAGSTDPSGNAGS